MKCFFFISVTTLLILSASACSSEIDPGQQDFYISGVIFRIEDYGTTNLRILVHDSTTRLDDVGDEVWFILNEETEVFLQEGLSFHRADREVLKVGAAVKGWSSTVWMYSNPPQAAARRLVIVKK